jgi:hypothetical protein
LSTKSYALALSNSRTNKVDLSPTHGTLNNYVVSIPEKSSHVLTLNKSAHAFLSMSNKPFLASKSLVARGLHPEAQHHSLPSEPFRFLFAQSQRSRRLSPDDPTTALPRDSYTDTPTVVYTSPHESSRRRDFLKSAFTHKEHSGS